MSRASAHRAILMLAALSTFPAAVVGQTLTLTTDSGEARTAFLEGWYHHQNVEPVTAHAAFTRACAQDPEFAAACAMAARTDGDMAYQQRIDRMDAAVPDLARATIGELLLVLAYRENLRGQVDGDFEGAIRSSNRLFGALAAVIPDDPHAAHAHAVSTAEWVFGADARTAALQQASERFPDYAPLLNFVAYEHANRGDLDRARAVVARYAALAPDSPNAHDSYAEILQWSGLLSEARAENRKAQELDPEFGAELSIADIQQLMGSGADARRTLLAGLDGAPTSRRRLPYLRSLAFSHLLDGDVEPGMARLQQVVDESLANGFPAWGAQALREMALLDAVLRDGSRADAYLQRAEALQPGRSFELFWKACAYATLGRLPEAREAHRALREAFPDDDNWNLTVEGWLLLAEGDAPGAVEILTRPAVANPYATALLSMAYGAVGMDADQTVLERQVRDSLRLTLFNSDRTIPTLLLDHVDVRGTR